MNNCTPNNRFRSRLFPPRCTPPVTPACTCMRRTFHTTIPHTQAHTPNKPARYSRLCTISREASNCKYNPAISSLNQFASYVGRFDINDNPDSDIPRIGANGTFLYSSRVVEDGSFLRLRNVSIGYTLPRRALRRLHLDTMRIYLSADNIWTWTGYTGPDPEVSTRNSVLTPGFDWSAYPRAFGLTGGISFTF